MSELENNLAEIDKTVQRLVDQVKHYQNLAEEYRLLVEKCLDLLRSERERHDRLKELRKEMQS